MSIFSRLFGSRAPESSGQGPGGGGDGGAGEAGGAVTGAPAEDPGRGGADGESDGSQPSGQPPDPANDALLMALRSLRGAVSPADEPIEVRHEAELHAIGTEFRRRAARFSTNLLRVRSIVRAREVGEVVAATLDAVQKGLGGSGLPGRARSGAAAAAGSVVNTGAGAAVQHTPAAASSGATGAGSVPDRVHVYRRDDERCAWVLLASTLPAREVVERRCVPFSEPGVLGHLASLSAPELARMGVLAATNAPPPLAPLFPAGRWPTVLAVPILVEERCFGVIQVESLASGVASSDEIQLLAGIAEIAGSALGHALRLQDASRAADRAVGALAGETETRRQLEASLERFAPATMMRRLASAGGAAGLADGGRAPGMGQADGMAVPASLAVPGGGAVPAPTVQPMAAVVIDFPAWADVTAQLEPGRISALATGIIDLVARQAADAGGCFDSFQLGRMLLTFASTLKAGRAALGCAAKVREALFEHLAAGDQPGFHRLAARIGVAAGPASVGAHGTGDRLAFTALGGCVSEAMRLAAAGADWQLVASADLVSGCAGAFTMAEDAGAEAVRGAVRITGIRDLAAFASLAGRAMPAAGAACGPGGRDEVAGGDGSQGAVAGGPGQSAGHGATRVSLRCAACNGENPPQCKFCNHCGMPMF